jgi:DNA ligase-1
VSPRAGKTFVPVESVRAAGDLPPGYYTEVYGSGQKPYTVTHHPDDTWSCTCPAWRFQSTGVVRTCKHLLGLFGAKKQSARTGMRFEEQPRPAAVPPPSRAKGGPKGVLLAEKWRPDIEPSCYFMSEKLDGVRAYWDGTGFWSRNGNEFHAPAWFTACLPRDEDLDGELFVGRKRFNETISVVRKDVPVDAEWKKVTFMVFDLPGHPGPFEARHAALQALVAKMRKRDPACPVEVVEQVVCTSPEHLAKVLKQVQKKGGEGLMLRKPRSLYERSRSWSLLKVKEFIDEEATIVGYVPGKGKHKGRLGAYEAKLKSGARFDVGTGLSDRDRETPLKIGTPITIRYQELTPAGIPRFPVFLAARTYE